MPGWVFPGIRGVLVSTDLIIRDCHGHGGLAPSLDATEQKALGSHRECCVEMDEMAMPQTHSMALGKPPNIHLPNDKVKVKVFCSSCLYSFIFILFLLSSPTKLLGQFLTTRHVPLPACYTAGLNRWFSSSTNIHNKSRLKSLKKYSDRERLF